MFLIVKSFLYTSVDCQKLAISLVYGIVLKYSTYICWYKWYLLSGMNQHET